MITYSLDDVLAYARCSMEWYWGRQPDMARPMTPSDLVPALIQQAAAIYYQGDVESMTQGVVTAITDWFVEWGHERMSQLVIQYVSRQAAIFAKFTSGEIKKGDGQVYVAPRLSKAYEKLLHQNGLVTISRELNAFAEGRLGLAIPADYGAGSAFGDAFADALRAAERADNQANGWPARESVLGCEQPFAVNIGNLNIIGRANLVLRPAVSEADTDTERGPSVAVEVHDYDTRPAFAWSALRNLKVIAAALSRSEDGAEVPWQHVEKVVYRHILSGKTFTFREFSPGRLLSVVSAITRGMRASVIVPRILTTPDDCRTCPYYKECSGKYWEALDMMDPTASAQATRLLTVMESVVASVGREPAVAAQTVAVLQRVQAEMEHVAPDAFAMISSANAAAQVITDQNGDKL
jgi:hypothetical protein